MVIRLLLFIISGSLLFGCTSTPTNSVLSNHSTENFQLLTANDGRVYRIDTRSGKTSWLNGSTFREVSEQTMLQLAIGMVYRAEDGKSMYRYEGGGKLIEWGPEKYWVTPEKGSKEN